MTGSEQVVLVVEDNKSNMRFCHDLLQAHGYKVVRAKDGSNGWHMAREHCPNLILFGPTFPHMWRPLSPVGEVVFKNVPCCGCRQESCIRPENNCMDLIGVGEVWESARKLIGES